MVRVGDVMTWYMRCLCQPWLILCDAAGVVGIVVQRSSKTRSNLPAPLGRSAS